MLWEVGDKDTEKDETDEIVSGYVNGWDRRIDVHGEDEVKDVWGGEVGASAAGRLVYPVGAHGGCSELSILNDVLVLCIEAILAEINP